MGQSWGMAGQDRNGAYQQPKVVVGPVAFFCSDENCMR